VWRMMQHMKSSGGPGLTHVLQDETRAAAGAPSAAVDYGGSRAAAREPRHGNRRGEGAVEGRETTTVEAIDLLRRCWWLERNSLFVL
jgi:hypothetical protein